VTKVIIKLFASLVIHATAVVLNLFKATTPFNFKFLSATHNNFYHNTNTK
jgi:hypothetical protein